LRRGAILAATAVAVAGCGGGSDNLTAGPPGPEESIHAFAGRFASAVEVGRQGKCDALQALSRTGAMQLNCGSRARRAFAGFRVTAAARYGTGGVVEFVDAETKAPKLAAGTTVSRAGARGVYTVALDSRGHWAFTGPVSPLLPGPTIGTRPGSRAGPARAVRQFVTAVKRSDCALFYRVTFTPGLDQSEACATTLGDYASLAKQLKDGDSRVLPLGGNGTFTFYGLRTEGDYRTVVVLKTAGGEAQPYLVMRAFRGPS
jgi:hypothetical protein